MQNMKKIEDREFVMVSDGDDSAGATVWWRLRGDCDRLALVVALSARGLEARGPVTHAPEVALRRAVGVLRGTRRLIRPLKRGSWAVVEEELKPSGEELKHWTGPTVSLDMIGRAVLKNASAEEATQVKEAYAYHLDALTTEDVSSWLITQVEHCGAVGLREGGGIYYLPPTAMSLWNALVEALGQASPKHTVYKVPTVRMTSDGARAIMDSLQAEAEAEVQRIDKDLSGGTLGVKALETRAEDAQSLLEKVEVYERLLDTRLEALRQTIADIQTDVVTAKLAAEAAAEEK
jgi:hypothetical protein